MEPILIPSVPREAFNKHRRMSDLVRHQVDHFKHIESKLPANIRAKLPQHAIVNEGEAARYIGAMTAYLLTRPIPATPALKRKTATIKAPVATRPRPPLALAAAAAPAPRKSASPKKTTPKKETAKAQKPSAKPKPAKASLKRKK